MNVLAMPGAAMPMPAVARILSRFDRPTLASFLSVAIDLLDVLDGEADSEGNGDDEPAGDDADASTGEWHLRPWPARRSGSEPRVECEDAEDDDPGGGNVEDEGEGIDEREPETSV